MEVGDKSKSDEGEQSHQAENVGASLSAEEGQERGDSQMSIMVDEDHSETEDEQEGLQMKGIKKNQNECTVSW